MGELQREPISPASLQGARIFSLASVNTSTRTKIWKHCKEKLDYMDSLVHHVWELMFWSIRCGFLHNFYSHSLCSRIALITAVSDQSHDSGVAQKKSSFCTASWWHGDTGHAPNGIGRNWTEMPLFTYVQIKIAGKIHVNSSPQNIRENPWVFDHHRIDLPRIHGSKSRLLLGPELELCACLHRKGDFTLSNAVCFAGGIM